MTGDLDDLRREMQGMTPDSDPARKAAALAAAMQAFDTHQENRTQETATPVRPMSDRPAGTGFLTGVLGMLGTLTTRQGLAATASVAAIAVGLGVVLAQMPKGVVPLPSPGVAVTADTPAPVEPLTEPAAPPSHSNTPLRVADDAGMARKFPPWSRSPACRAADARIHDIAR